MATAARIGPRGENGPHPHPMRIGLPPLRQPNRLSLTSERGAILCALLMLVLAFRYG